MLLLRLLYSKSFCSASSLQLIHICSLSTQVYFSGIQPTGIPHIGNYFGFIQNWLTIQKTKTNAKKFLSIVDLHATTVGFPQPNVLRKNVLTTTASLLAAGVNPEQTILFQQSNIMEHTQLFWILASLQSIARLQRLPQYKDKSAKYNDKDIPVGLLCYPVLQASDVLLYKGTHVPVGADQNQHMHVLRDLAVLFNSQFNCNYFPIPEMVLSKSSRIKSLTDPSKKMSKSDLSKWSTLFIADHADLVVAKIKKAISDFDPTITYDLEERPAVSNLIHIYSSFTGKTPEEIVVESSGLDHRKFKERLIEVAEETIRPIRNEYDRLIQDESYLKKILDEGNIKASRIAQNHMNEIKEIVGFL